MLCCCKGDRNDDDHPAPRTHSVKSAQPQPETKTQKTPENVKADANEKPVAKVEPDSSSTDVTQEKQKPGPRDLWKEAYEALDDGDKKYVPPSGASAQGAIEDVITETKSRYTEWKNGGLKIGGKNGQINIRDSAEKILNAAMKTSDVISTIVSFDPTGHGEFSYIDIRELWLTNWDFSIIRVDSDLIWNECKNLVVTFRMSRESLYRYKSQVVGNSLERRDAIFAASEYLSEKLAYYALIDANYRNQGVGSDQELDQRLFDVYKAILCFTVDVKKAQHENAASRLIVI